MAKTIALGREIVRLGIATRDYTGIVAYHLYMSPAGWSEAPEMRTENGRWYRRREFIVGVSAHEEADGEHWLHLSASAEGRYPTYAELTDVKEDFIGPHRKAVHIWPKADEHVNCHPYCLHLWACLTKDPLPDFRHFDEASGVWRI